MIPVPGDVACEDLRVEDGGTREELWSQIDVIIHSAATTKFDERSWWTNKEMNGMKFTKNDVQINETFM